MVGLVQRYINELVEDAPDVGWEEAYGSVVGGLSPLIRAGEVERQEASYRLFHVLRRWTDPSQARVLAEALPYRDRDANCDGNRADSGHTSRHGQRRDRNANCDGNRADSGHTSRYGQRLTISAFRSPRDARPRAATVTWSALAERLLDVRVYPAKDTCPLWTPARFAGDRRLAEQVVDVSCLVLDFDDGTHWRDVLPRWKGIAGVVHSSWSHTPEHPKWRLVMPLARPVPREAWGRVWAWASKRVDETNDLKCKDPGRIYFAPAKPDPTVEHKAFVLDGRALDVPASLLRAPQADPMVRPPPQHGRGRNADRYKRDPDARRELGERLGGKLVSGGNQVKGVTCPACGRPSLAWWIPLGAQLQARCNHQNSCGASFWLDQLDT